MKFLPVIFVFLFLTARMSGTAHAAPDINENEDSDEIGMAVDVRDNILLEYPALKFINDFYYTYTPCAAEIIDVDEKPELEHLVQLMGASLSLMYVAYQLLPVIIPVCVIMFAVIFAGIIQKLSGIRARHAAPASALVTALCGAILYFAINPDKEFGEIRALPERFVTQDEWTGIKKNILSIYETSEDAGEISKELAKINMEPFVKNPAGKMPADALKTINGLPAMARSLQECTEKADGACKKLSASCSGIKARQKEWEKANSESFVKNPDAEVRFEAFKALCGISTKTAKMQNKLDDANKQYMDETVRAFLKIRAVYNDCEKLKAANADLAKSLPEIKSALDAWEKANRSEQVSYQKLVKMLRELALELRKNSEKNLMAGLSDPDQRVKLWAALALGELRVKEAVPKLTTILLDTEEEIHPRDKAARALEKIGDPSAIPALEKIVKDNELFFLTIDANNALSTLRKKKTK
ncbi:MAG: HEAT repeat domain-containing protein [Planctomycetes bacterium]|nr:HEAT repeat domain-containing protein [Planctomycetota bacterium]